MTLKEYFEALENHDWYYEYSDDYSVWSRGERSHRELKYIAKGSEKHRELYNAFVSHHFSGKPWGTEQTPEPKLEDFND